MPRYKIRAQETINWYIEVDAEDEDQAYELGVNTYMGSNDIPEDVVVRETTTDFETLAIEEIGESA